LLVVIDTNVLVSALLGFSKENVKPPRKIVEYMLGGVLTPCYSGFMVKEYSRVLNDEKKFGLSADNVQRVVGYIENKGKSFENRNLAINFADKDDLPFYDVYLQSGGILITGNLKHYPQEAKIVNPAEFLSMIGSVFIVL
jgi:predicted nucleic acid-binding protein